MTTPTWQIPLKTFFEKDGTFVNFQGKKQEFKRIATIVPKAMGLTDVTKVLSGRGEGASQGDKSDLDWKKTNFFVQQRGPL